MRSFIQQFDSTSWPTLTGPVVVFMRKKNNKFWLVIMSVNLLIEKSSGNQSATKSVGNRDGPLIFHMRDGPPGITGSQGGAGPPEKIHSGFSVSRIKGQLMEWLVKKKTLETL